jgi:hypothetical protein
MDERYIRNSWKNPDIQNTSVVYSWVLAFVGWALPTISV